MSTTKPRMLMITMTTTALAASSAAFAQAGFSLGPTFDYSSGKFGGTQSTDVTSIGVAARYERGPLSLRVNVPYVRIDGPGNVVPSGDSRGTQIESESGNRRGRSQGGPQNDDNSGSGSSGSGSSGSGSSGSGSSGSSSSGSGSSSTSRKSQSGLGDVVVALAYNLVDSTATGLIFDITGKVKIPTADESKALGTGKFDYSIQGDLEKTLGANWSVFTTLGYRWLGDPQGLALNNVVFASLGTSYKVAPKSTVGVAYDFRQATFDSGKSLQEVALFTSYRASDTTRLRAYVFKGLTDGGPDWGAGVSALFTF